MCVGGSYACRRYIVDVVRAVHTEPSTVSIYLCEHRLVYSVELWLPVESVIHQLKNVLGPKRFGL